jgi:hypothetical protein
VPEDARNFFTAQQDIMKKMASKQTNAKKFYGHLFTVAEMPPKDWSMASAEAFYLDNANPEGTKLLWQAQVGTFNQLFGAVVASTRKVDDLY